MHDGGRHDAPSEQLTAAMIVLLCVLYLAAFACFAGAVTLVVIAIRSLLRVCKT